MRFGGTRACPRNTWGKKRHATHAHEEEGLLLAPFRSSRSHSQRQSAHGSSSAMGRASRDTWSGSSNGSLDALLLPAAGKAGDLLSVLQGPPSGGAAGRKAATRPPAAPPLPAPPTRTATKAAPAVPLSPMPSQPRLARGSSTSPAAAALSLCKSPALVSQMQLRPISYSFLF